MIKILDEHFIAEGTYQKCYRHPSNQNLCIKISKQNIEISRLAYEIKYCEKISKKKIKKKDYQFFSIFHGTVETNLGKGYVFDLIKDETNQEISKTLEYYLLNPNPAISDQTLKIAFERLIQLMAKYKIIANDIRAKNICCKILKNKTIELIHIDGLGHRDFIPLVNWFSYFAKKKIERRLLRFDLYDLDVHRNYLKSFYKNQDDTIQ
ncbi:YrbL family protein [Flavivirga jejuensis]|uniref:YrbL family protein n=1 Tax=Flavivirga jejuensis TaxID=870487 RepID=A0ABT8WUX9_9FLAO|nr:YrbL family protein [Flavivirga jejuensis]MDO5976998.1 YrbL family protein [Flavivirga jejuensis]